MSTSVPFVNTIDEDINAWSCCIHISNCEKRWSGHREDDYRDDISYTLNPCPTTHEIKISEITISNIRLPVVSACICEGVLSIKYNDDEEQSSKWYPKCWKTSWFLTAIRESPGFIYELHIDKDKIAPDWTWTLEEVDAYTSKMKYLDRKEDARVYERDIECAEHAVNVLKTNDPEWPGRIQPAIRRITKIKSLLKRDYVCQVMEEFYPETLHLAQKLLAEEIPM